MEWQATDLRPSEGIRWAVGEHNGRRSATWRFWGNKKGDFYLAARVLGGIMKASLHRDGRCHVGFTTDFAAKQHLASRHMDRWTVPTDQLVKAIQVVMPEEDLSIHDVDDKEPMRWLRTPSPGYMAFAGVLVLPSANVEALAGSWPGAAHGTEPIGVISSNTRTAFVVHWQNPMTPEQVNTLRDLRRHLAQVGLGEGIEQAPGIRAVVVGEIGDGLTSTHSLFDIAYQAA